MVPAVAMPEVPHNNLDDGGHSGRSSLADVVPPVTLQYADDPRSFKAAWRELELNGHATVFQSFRWVDTWCRKVAPQRGERPFIILATDSTGRPLFLWPLSIRRQHGLPVLGWLGQEHASYNLGLYAAEPGSTPAPNEIWSLLKEAARQHPELAAIHFTAQPRSWNGFVNPFTALPQLESPSPAFALALGDNFDRLYETSVSKQTRQNIKRKQKKLEDTPGFAIGEARPEAERLHLLDVYFAQKARQLAEMGAPNVFADPVIADFYRDLAVAGPSGSALHESHFARVGDQIIATANGIVHGGRYYLLTASFDDQSEHGKHSPGLVLFKEQIASLVGRGVTTYDFGVGEGRHKTSWSPATVPLFETFVPLTAAGWAVTALRAGTLFAKRTVKSNEALFSKAKLVRRLLAKGLKRPEQVPK